MERKAEGAIAPKKKGSGRKKKGKNKNAGNKNGGGKNKRIPLQIFATGGGLREVDVDEVDASVLYHKSVTGAIQVKLGDIAVRGSVTMSYDLSLILPGYGATTQGGVLCDLMGSTYLLQNPSPYTLTIRLQRPMGYRDDSASLAMWEPLGGELVYTLRPRGTLKLGSANNATSHMVPREITISGKRCVHLLSFAVYREPMTDFGSTPTDSVVKSEVGLIVEAVTRYKSINGDAGQMDGYAVESFKGSDRLNHICHGPLVALRLSDVCIKAGPVTKCFIVKEKSGYVQLLFSSSNQQEQVPDIDLDPTTSYRIDTPLLLMDGGGKAVVSNVIGALKTGSTYMWLYGLLGGEGAGMKFTPCKFKNDSVLPDELPVDSWLHPVALNSKSKVKSRQKSGVVAIQSYRLKHGGVEAHRNLDDGFFTTFVKAVVVIFEVTKVAVEILGVVGVLANPDLQQAESIDGVLD